jgi:hypothetical protein
MGLDISGLPRWIFSFAAGLIAILLFIFLVWPRPCVDAGLYGHWGVGCTRVSSINVPIRIGPRGIEGKEIADPGEYSSNQRGWTAIGGSKGYPLCLINNIYNDGEHGSCELHHDTKEGPWFIQVTGSMRCRVSCFEIE